MTRVDNFQGEVNTKQDHSRSAESTETRASQGTDNLRMVLNSQHFGGIVSINSQRCQSTGRTTPTPLFGVHAAVQAAKILQQKGWKVNTVDVPTYLQDLEYSSNTIYNKRQKTVLHRRQQAAQCSVRSVVHGLYGLYGLYRQYSTLLHRRLHPHLCTIQTVYSTACTVPLHMYLTFIL